MSQRKVKEGFDSSSSSTPPTPKDKLTISDEESQDAALLAERYPEALEELLETHQISYKTWQKADAIVEQKQK